MSSVSRIIDTAGIRRDSVCAKKTAAESPSNDSHSGADNEPDAVARARFVASSVADPELPFVTVEDLGILRSVTMAGGEVTARVSPTYSGCPAVAVIEQSILQALLDAGFNARVERVMSPAWTTDWITEIGREKLRQNGIAPPVSDSGAKPALFAKPSVICPRCASTATARISEFGSTPCKAQYRCGDCHEPFDYFKCH